MTSTSSKNWPSLQEQASARGLDPKLVELAGKADEAIRKGDEAVRKGIDKAGTYAAENRDKVDGMLDKAAATIDSKTGGKYHSQIVTVRTQVAKGVDRLAEQSAATSTPAADAFAAASDQPTTPAPAAEFPVGGEPVGEDAPKA